MRIRINAIQQTDDGEAQAISDHMAELLRDDTPTLAFMWDHAAEMWFGAAMWENDGGCNFELEPELAATLTALFTTLRMMVKGIEVVDDRDT